MPPLFATRCHTIYVWIVAFREMLKGDALCSAVPHGRRTMYAHRDPTNRRVQHLP